MMTFTHLTFSPTDSSHSSIFINSRRIGRHPYWTFVTEDRPRVYKFSFRRSPGFGPPRKD